jgi:hypothetical protein
MSLVLAGSRRIVVVLAFCECVAPTRHGPARRGQPVLDRWRVPAASPPDGAIARVRRLHWLVAGWLIGLTVLVIERGAPASVR